MQQRITAARKGEWLRLTGHEIAEKTMGIRKIRYQPDSFLGCFNRFINRIDQPVNFRHSFWTNTL